jgi:DNA-binding response OmpR family regulator
LPEILDRTVAKPRLSNGVVFVSTPRREAAETLADVLQCAGYAAVWHQTGRALSVVRGACAGIWDGGQLDPGEANDLDVFCRRLRRMGAPVVALLDFPRRDRYAHAREIGANAVLGKPWLNGDLIAALQEAIVASASAHAA